MRACGVSAGLMLLIVVSAACGSSAKGASAGAAGRSSIPQSSNPTSSYPLGTGGIEPSTVVARQTLPSGQIAHAVEIAEAIRATGGGCATATVETEPPGDPFFKEQVSCSIGDDEIAISLYANHAGLMHGRSLLERAVCFSAATQKSMNLTYVIGDNWIVFPQRTATARQLASRLHASLATLHC